MKVNGTQIVNWVIGLSNFIKMARAAVVYKMNMKKKALYYTKEGKVGTYCTPRTSYT